MYSLGALDRGWLRTVHEATESGLTRLILGAKTLASTPIFPDVQMPFIHFKDSINDYLIFVSGPLFGIYKSVAGVDKGLFAYDEPTLDPPVDSLVFLGGDYVVPIINGAKLGLSHPQVGDYLWDGSLLTNLNAEKITSGQLADARFLNAFLRNGSREMLGTAIMRTILPETSGIYDIGSPTSRFLGADFAGSVNCKYISPERIYWTGLIADPTYLTGQVWYRSDIRRIRFNEPAATVRNVVGNPVFEDLEFGSYKAHFGETYIERAEENWLRIKNDAGSLANLMVSGINLYYGLTTYSLDSFMQTYWSPSAYFRFRSWDGSYRDCALLTNGRIDIPRAGDINILDGRKVSTPLVEVDTINEKTSGAGVTIDGVLCKDNNLDLGINKLLTTNLGLKEIDSTTMGVRNRADSAYVDFTLNRILKFQYANLALWALDANTIAIMNRTGSGYESMRAYEIQVYNGFGSLSGYPLLFKQHNAGGTRETVARGVAEATANLQIDQAGHITMLSGKVLNNLAGVFRLPNTAPASPVANDCYFDAATNTLYVYNGTAWKSVVLS